MRHVENDYSFKNRWLSLNSEKVELLAIGSSHCYWEINPMYLSYFSFNAGHNGQSIKYDYLIFNKFFERLKSLKFIIVTISYGDPFLNMKDVPLTKPFVKYYTLYYNLYPENFFERFEISEGIDYEAICNYLFKHKNFKTCSETGFFSFTTSNDKHWKDKALDDVMLSSFDNFYGDLHQQLVDNYYMNLRYMENIINLCQAKGTQVILLTTPTHELYREYINEDEWKLTTYFCHHLVQEFDNVSYLNLFQDSRFSDGDFWNSNHLNDTGATKLSLILNDYINENFPN